MFLSSLFRRISHSKRTFFIIVAGVAIVCVTSMIILALSSLGVFDEPIEATSPITTRNLETATPEISAEAFVFPRCVDASSLVTGKVVEVRDGDTINVLDENGVESVRYIGIDTPEVGQFQTKLGMEAYQKNVDLVLGKEVSLYTDTTDVDAYDRSLRYVFVDDVWVNHELVALGLAEEEPYEPDTACRWELTKAEMKAREAHLGIWLTEKNQTARNIENFGTDTSVGNYLPGSIWISDVNEKMEYVDLFNNSTADIDLKGWYLVSERGDQVCPLDTTLKVGKTLRVFSQKGKNGFNCNSPEPIWHNTNQDPAVLYDPAGNTIARK